MKIPGAFYRLQFNGDFTFEDASRYAGYFSRLGITHIYASPVLKAREGSRHGYDVVDTRTLNPELGGLDQFEKLSSVLSSSGIGWMQDIVPNHMAFASGNRILMDLFEKGKRSNYYDFFDVDWDSPHESLKGKVLAPFLGDNYGNILEKGEIVLKYECGTLLASYYEHSYPLLLSSYPGVFEKAVIMLKEEKGESASEVYKLMGALALFRNIDKSVDAKDLYSHSSHAKKMLWEIYVTEPSINKCMDRSIRELNGHEGDPSSFDALDALLREQKFRFSFWKVATEELNYRRFFSINSLICLRMENEEVFERTHELIFSLVEKGYINALRIDHVDGLSCPFQYLSSVRRRFPDLYIVVEKILEKEESLPGAWPVQGTTGYDFLNMLNGLYCDTRNRSDFIKLYYKYTQRSILFENMLAEKKRLIIGKHMAGDIDNLARLLKEKAGTERKARDYTLYGLRRALVEIMAFFPVYRIYTEDRSNREEECEYLSFAVNRAKRSNPMLRNEMDFIAEIVTGAIKNGNDKADTAGRDFIKRFQQFTGPLMAKGFEDTVLYVYNKLISLNEVGGDPLSFGTSLELFSEYCRSRSDKTPYSINTTSTHDTKRGEDVRMRINVLSEIPGEWNEKLVKWRRLNRGKKKNIGGERLPDANDEYFFYQTLLGTYPPKAVSHGDRYVERIKSYVIKAVREAKVHTAWIEPDKDYEEAFISFAERVLDDNGENRFLEDFQEFSARISFYGMLNSLSQIAVKFTAPGVPDIYQGSELWDLALVDPDNRRVVDLSLRETYLREIEALRSGEVCRALTGYMERWQDGKIKMLLIRSLLAFRKEIPEVFSKGAFSLVETGGGYSYNIISFVRDNGKNGIITIAPRFLSEITCPGTFPLGKMWGDTVIKCKVPAGSLLTDLVTGKEMRVPVDGIISVKDLFSEFPVGVLKYSK
jgi:(1->4)-alpha-D-glucan 1-alpha-D-glucosylmutase